MQIKISQLITLRRMSRLMTPFVTLTFHVVLVAALFQRVAIVGAQSSSIPFYNDADPSFLFIGNSYTSYNTLHEMFANIMRDGVPEWSESLYTQSVNPGGRKLYQHLTDLEGGGALQTLLAPADTNPNAWKWVVLQDQSQLPGFYPWDGEGTEFYNSFTAAQALDEYIEGTGAQTMFYMTWGRRIGDVNNQDYYPDFLTMQGHLTEGYMRYLNGASTPDRPTYMAPVGLVFQTIHNDLVDEGIMPTDDGTLFTQLYTGDNSHPAPPGTYVAALTLFTSMTGIDPTTIDFWPDSIDEETARTLQDAVSRTVLETFENGFIPYAWTRSWTGSTAATGSLPAEAVVTKAPTKSPTLRPTNAPTRAPTLRPTTSPTRLPTNAPTKAPTLRPTVSPTRSPTPEPTLRPTREPTLSPTPVPTTSMPTIPDATRNPTLAPVITESPTISETTSNPTVAPTTSAPIVSDATNNPTVDLSDSNTPTVIGVTSDPTVDPNMTNAPTVAPTVVGASSDPTVVASSSAPTSTGATLNPTAILENGEVASPAGTLTPSTGSTPTTLSPTFTAFVPGSESIETLAPASTVPTAIAPNVTLAPTVAKLEPLPTPASPQAIVVLPAVSSEVGNFVGAGMDDVSAGTQHVRMYLRCFLVPFGLAILFLQ